MKKGFFSLVAILTITLMSCGSNASDNVPTQDSTAVNQDSIAVADSSIGANGGGGDLKRNEGLDVK
jgi:hypothetical protein